ncbi:MAG: response regulator [Planctomycetes bacterium]|nr:response regulator [Planctomycetota bacterium]
MNDTLRLLHLEDSPYDAELIRHCLIRVWKDVEIVVADTREAFERQLDSGRYDLILADYKVPGFDGELALKLARERHPDTPVIFVSGTIGEDAAVQCLLEGAADYVLKDNLRRLPSAVERTLREADEQRRRKKAEEAVRERESRLRRIVDSNIAGIFFWDLNGKVVEANDAFLKMTGYTPEDLRAGRLDWKAMTPPEYLERDARAVEELKTKGAVTPYEKEYLRKDGSPFPVLLGFAAFEGGMDRGVGFVLDLSQRKNLEDQLRQAQRMEVVGRLAGGVAHDFNNLLTPILGLSDLILGQIKPDDPVRSDIEEIKKAGQRAARLTRQLLAFSRKQVLQPRVVDLNESVQEMQMLLGRLIGEDVTLSLQLSPEGGRVKVDPGQMEQVIMNLAINARDAMPQGGKLTIETRRVFLDEEYAGRHVGVVPGYHVVLIVSDTGTGMDKETMGHLFEPFFTTKPQGKGTGLGLATVYGIIKQSGGHIWAYSEPKRGSTFKVYLPEARDEKASRVVSTETRSYSKASETILLLEDDDALRGFACRVLRMRGFTVLEAGSGEDAIKISITHPGPIDLLLTDIVMPEMNGPEVARQIRKVRKGIRVLYMSGYSENAIVHQGVLEPGTSLLEKPFSLQALARKVREVLDAPQVSG